MAAFSDLVKQYGSVSAALKAQGMTKNDDGKWVSGSGSSGSGTGAATQTSGGTATSVQYASTPTTTQQSSVNTNRNYHQEAIDAAKLGDWATVNSALAARQEKVAAQGGNDRGVTAQQIYQSLLAQYGSPSSGSPKDGTMSRDEMTSQLYAGNNVGDSGSHLGDGWETGTDYLAAALEYAKSGNLTDAYTALEKRGYKMADTGSAGGGISQDQAYNLVQQAFDQSGELERQYGVYRDANAARLAASGATANPANAYKTITKVGSDGKRYYVTYDGQGNPITAAAVNTGGYSQEEIDARAAYLQNGFNLQDYYNIHNMAVDRTGVGAMYNQNGTLALNAEDYTPQSLWPNGVTLPSGSANLIQGGTAQGVTPGVQGGVSGVGNGSLSGGYGSFQDFLEGTGYQDYSDATQAAIRASVQQAVNQYNQQIQTTNEDSGELARQAYIAKMLGQKNLDQQLSANGYAGGMADSQRIATETNYENNLASIEQQRLATVRELENAIASAQLTGDMQTAQELASYLQQVQSQWVSYVQNQQALENQNYWNQQQMDQENYWNQQSVSQQQTATAYERAMNYLAVGVMPDAATLSAAGMSAAEAAAIRDYYTSAAAGNARTVQTVQEVATPVAETPAAATQTQLMMSYEDLKSTLERYLSLGGRQRAANILNQYWDSLTPAQQQELSTLYG